MSAVAGGIDDRALEELAQVLGAEHLITSKPARMHRARVPAPFPVHRWADHTPDAVVLPGSTEEVAEIVKIANRFGVPVVPRSGGTGLTDGAVPLRHGILLDLKRLDRLIELDLENRTCTVGAGMNMLKLNERLGPHGLIYPDDPASYPCSLVGGRIGTSGWSLIGSRYGHTRDLVLSFVHVLPTGEVVRFGDGGGAQALQELDRLHAQAAVHGPPGHARRGDRGDAEALPQAGGRALPVLGLRGLRHRAPRAARHRPDRLRDVRRRGALRRAEGRATCGATTRPTSRSRTTSARSSAPSSTATRTRSASAASGCMRVARENGARYLGDEISQGDWAARHDRYATPLHGRTKAGQVVPMSWHCEDAAINWTELPAVRREWHEIVARLRAQTDVFDDWGMFAYTSARTGVELPDRDRRRHLGAGARRRDLGDVGATPSATSPRSRSRTAARSAPATARAARARSTSSPTSWAAATT